jgi:hypothetical protein
MTFPRSLETALALIVAALFALPAVAFASAPDGRQTFVDMKCNTCHTVESLGIEVLPDEEEDEEEQQITDLSTVGDRRDTDWIQRFLKREERIDGQRHRRRFRGSDAELEALATWLSSLKAESGE